jgi:hypothetical protein
MTDQLWLLITVALLSLYVVGIGGATASALGVREAWRRRGHPETDLRAPEVSLDAPSLPKIVRVIRVVGWVSFPLALVLGVFANRHFPWVGPVTVVVMVGLNAFYFSAVQGMGERLTLAADGFRLGKRSVRWVHVTELTAAHVGSFGGMRISDPGGWQDPKASPNAVLYRLNRALVTPRKSILDRWSGLNYYDGMVRSSFGVSTEKLLQSMVERRRQAIETETPLLQRLLDGRPGGVRSPEA